MTGGSLPNRFDLTNWHGTAFVDGKESAGIRAKRVKHNEQISKTDQTRRKLQEMVVAALFRSPDFRRAAVPHRIRPPLISRYKPGMSYGLHVDDALMGPVEARDRSDVSVTVFISEPADYQGGELVIHTPYGQQAIKLPAGHAVAYPSNSLHEVTEVTGGGLKSSRGSALISAAADFSCSAVAPARFLSASSSSCRASSSFRDFARVSVRACVTSIRWLRR